MNDQEIEQEIQAKGLTAPRVTPADIEAEIASEYYFTAGDGMVGNPDIDLSPREDVDALELVTFCAILLRNGHRIVGVNTGPVSPGNFDAELGKKLARQNAIDQIWPLLGFALRDRFHQQQGSV